VVQGPNILELEIEPSNQAPITAKRIEEPFVDPAIVSYGRPPTQEFRPSQSSSTSQPNGLQSSAPPSVLSEADTAAPSITLSAVSSKPAIPVTTKPRVAVPWNEPDEIRNDSVASATLTSPFDGLTLADDLGMREVADYNGGNEELDEKDKIALDQALPMLQAPSERVGRRTRRGRRGRGAREMLTGEDRIHPHENPDLNAVSRPLFEAASGNARKRNKGTGSNGWRQTPLLEDTSRANLSAPNSLNRSARRAEAALRKGKVRRHGKLVLEEQKGWATEDATDIQDMGDFDFVGNLSKFDKREVFDQIRQYDSTAHEELLVSLNRLSHRPGTAGGKNLHHTENVLSPKVNDIVEWNSEAGNSDEDARESRVSSSKTSGRNTSRASIRKSPPRKGTAMATVQQRTGPGIATKPVGRESYSPHSLGVSPMPKLSRLSKTSNGSLKPLLRLVPSGDLCPCLSPLQMLELEQLAISELDLSEDMISENASRGIAETARKIISANVNHEAGSLDKTSRSVPLVIILAGNNKTGARAIAGGRQLRNHGTRVLVCVLGSEGEQDLLDSVRRQLNIYRKFGGQVTSPNELWKTLKYINSPIELIVDALLGMHMSLDDLRKDDQAVFHELATWANDGIIDVLTIDVPSGIDAASGESTRNAKVTQLLTLVRQVLQIFSFIQPIYYLWAPLRLVF